MPPRRTPTIPALAPLALAIALVTSPALAQVPTIAGVDVHAELEDVEGANAMTFWPDLPRDLEAAITAASAPADRAPRIEVRLTEISLDGATALPVDGRFNTLEGWVYVYGDPDSDAEPAAPIHSERLRLEASMLPSGGAGNVALPEDRAVYDALIAAFAAITLEAVPEQ